MTKEETLAERVQRMRDAKGWTQTQLADEAEMAPAALSRLLTGERPPRMEHLLALARALGVTVTELTTGTAAASAIRDWIAREDYERCEKAVADAERDLAVARADADARTAEAKSLGNEIASLTADRERLERELAEARAQAARAEQLAQEKIAFERTVLTLGAEKRSAEAARIALQRELAKVTNQCNVNYQAVLELTQRVNGLQVDLKNAKDGQVATGLFSAALGAILTGTAVAAAGSSSGRKRG